jgi:plastin-1
LINSSKADTIDERVINKLSEKKKKLNKFEQSENCTLCVNSAAGIGVSTVNIGSGDLMEGTPHIVLGLVWQIIKIGLFAEISLKDHPELIVLMEEGETVADMLKKNPEEILRRWFNYQLNKAESKRRVKGFTDDIKDSECYTLVLNVITKGKASKEPLNESDPEKRAEAMLVEAQKCDVNKFVTPKTIVKPNPKLNLAFVANLFNTYPNLEQVDTSVRFQNFKTFHRTLLNSWTLTKKEQEKKELSDFGFNPWDLIVKIYSTI